MSRSVKSKTGFQSITNFTMQQTIMDLISGLRQALLLSSLVAFSVGDFSRSKDDSKKCAGLL